MLSCLGMLLLFTLIYVIFIILILLLIPSLFKFLPWYAYVYPCFIFRKKTLNYTRPIKVGMIIDFTYIKAVYKHSKISEYTWNKCFVLALKKLFNELCKYENQTFFAKTHTKILKKLKLKEKQGFIEIIECTPTGEKYLWYTLKPPFEKTMFYEITFKIRP